MIGTNVSESVGCHMYNGIKKSYRTEFGIINCRGCVVMGWPCGGYTPRVYSGNLFNRDGKLAAFLVSIYGAVLNTRSQLLAGL